MHPIHDCKQQIKYNNLSNESLTASQVTNSDGRYCVVQLTAISSANRPLNISDCPHVHCTRIFKGLAFFAIEKGGAKKQKCKFASECFDFLFALFYS